MSSVGEGAPRDLVGYGRHPPDPQWPGGARLAVNFVINVEEGSEPSVPDGDGRSEVGLTEASTSSVPPGVRDLAAESMFEYGARVGFWRLIRIFEERGLPLTVFGWYCRYGPSVNTRRLLVEEGGFLYDSDAYNDELPYWCTVAGRPHLIVPYSLTNNDSKLARGMLATAADYFAFMRDAFDLLYQEGEKSPKMMSLGLHLRVIGHPARAAGLIRLLDHIASKPDVWITRRLDIARHWQVHHPMTTSSGPR